jgi:tetratricopeptide (TPR) repeat protein
MFIAYNKEGSMFKQVGMSMVGLCLLATIGFCQAPAEPLLPGPGSEGAVAPDPMTMNPEELIVCAQTTLQQGDTNTALYMLTICHGKSMQQQAERYNLLLSTLLAAGDLQDAERVYQENMAQTDRITRGYIALLHQYYVNQKNDQALLDWAASLQTMAGLPQDLRVQAFSWQLDVSRAMGPVSRVTDLFPVCVSNFDAATSFALLMGMVSAYNDANDLKAVADVLDAIAGIADKRPDLSLMVTCQRVNLLFSSAKWAEAEASFKKQAPALPDAELTGCFMFARMCAIQAKQNELADRLCDFVIKEQKSKPGAWQAAANAWLENAKSFKTLDDIPVRLEALKGMGFDNNSLITFFYDFGGPVIIEGKSEDQKALLKFGEPLLKAKIADKQKKEYFQIMISEIYFMLKDYDKALDLFEAPLSIMESSQQAILIAKLKAHQAQKKGNYKNAIKGFRDYMETVKLWTAPATFPYSNTTYTKEMCLGLNAQRIGDIYVSMKDDKAAQAAFKEADGYYVVAQKGFKPNSKENEYVKDRRAELAKLIK